MLHLPSVYKHVKEESPYLYPPVGSVDEHAVGGHGAGRLDVPLLQRVVDEEPNLDTHQAHGGEKRPLIPSW